MAIHTGENEQGLRKIVDMTRLISIVLLIVHFYYYCYAAFLEWELTATLTDRLITNIQHSGLFNNFHKSKAIALIFLLISLVGAKGRKNEKIKYTTAFAYLLTGLLVYFFSYLCLLTTLKPTTASILYIAVTVTGFVLVLTGGTLLCRVIELKFNNKDVFNKENETFPQEECLIKNDYSINLPACYNLRGKWRKSWINVTNPFRGLIVLGSPGSGKTYFEIRHVITQHIRKKFTMFIYDFKYDDLSLIAYNCLLKHKHLYPVEPKFYVINFDDLTRSNRCNPLNHLTMLDITDAAEAARTILMDLNREWIRRQGDFFVESSINFLNAVIWFLCRYRD